MALLFLLFFDKRLRGPLANSAFTRNPIPHTAQIAILEAAYYKADTVANIEVFLFTIFDLRI